MKVLLVAPVYSPIIQRLIAALENTGVDLIVASHNAKHIPNVIDLGTCRSMLSYLSFWKIKKIINKYQPDIVHAHVINHYGLMCSFVKKPLLIALWGSDVMLAPNQGSLIKKLIFRKINKFVLKRATHIHTSGFHVANTAKEQCSGIDKKLSVFYWGFPLPKPTEKQHQILSEKIFGEFGIKKESELIVFPRGLSPVYNPKSAALIINHLLEKGIDNKKIVVLKGFADKDSVAEFLKLIDRKNIIFIDRLLSSDELYYIYRRTKIHFSIPLSDSLGGGVIEPALLGSIPVLSSLPSYHAYSKKHHAYILSDYTESSLDKLCLFMKLEKNIGRERAVNELNEVYSLKSIRQKILSLYREIK